MEFDAVSSDTWEKHRGSHHSANELIIELNSAQQRPSVVHLHCAKFANDDFSSNCASPPHPCSRSAPHSVSMRLMFLRKYTWRASFHDSYVDLVNVPASSKHASPLPPQPPAFALLKIMNWPGCNQTCPHRFNMSTHANDASHFQMQSTQAKHITISTNTQISCDEALKLVIEGWRCSYEVGFPPTPPTLRLPLSP